MGTLRTLVRIENHIVNRMQEQYFVDLEEVTYRLAYPLKSRINYPFEYHRERDQILGWRFIDE